MPAYPIEKIYSIISELELDIDIIFIKTDISYKEKDIIPACPGVYILKNCFGKIYIGCSNNISSRLRCHHIANVNTIDIFLIEDIIMIRKLEKYLIYILIPELNRQVNIYNMNEEERINFVKSKIGTSFDMFSPAYSHLYSLNTYKPVTIRDDTYKRLESLKTKTNRSFSDVIDSLIEENKEFAEENKKLIEELDNIKKMVGSIM